MRQRKKNAASCRAAFWQGIGTPRSPSMAQLFRFGSPGPAFHGRAFAKAARQCRANTPWLTP
jgi:hypothetical protein